MKQNVHVKNVALLIHLTSQNFDLLFCSPMHYLFWSFCLYFTIFRCAISKEFSHNRKDHFKKTVPSVRTYLSSTFQGSCAAQRGGPSQHILQAFHLLCAGVQSDRTTRTRSVTGVNRQTDQQGQITLPLHMCTTSLYFRVNQITPRVYYMDRYPCCPF